MSKPLAYLLFLTGRIDITIKDSMKRALKCPDKLELGRKKCLH